MFSFFQYLNNLDIKLSIFINSLHNSFLDFIMFYLSEPMALAPFIVLFLLLLIKEYKKNAIIVVAALITTVSLADSITFLIFKPLFGVLRPCHNPLISDSLHLLPDICGGMYGFASSHAANIFAISTFMYLMLGHKYPKMKYLFVVAVLVCYSRVYLGVHYVSDVVVGGILGVFISKGIYSFLTHLFQNIKKISNSKILYFKDKKPKQTKPKEDEW